MSGTVRGPVDPRLLRRARSMRGFLAGGAVLGLVQTGAVIGFAWFVSALVTGAIAGQGVAELAPLFWGLAGTVAVRALTVWAMDATAAAGAARVKSELRVAVLQALRRLGPGRAAGRGSAATATVVGPGLDTLDGYFAKYLPQLILTVIATPLLVIAIFLGDWLSALIVVLALPLIPVFMVLIGLATQSVQRGQLQSLQQLSGAFLDVVGGLSTLKIFGRERRQLGRIRQVTERYRVETMKVLRLSFLSGFVLEIAGSLSVALIAVTAGLRLLDGQLGLGVALFVLILAPEVFLPLRNVGAQFHAAADGVAASEQLFQIIEEAEASGCPAGRDSRDASVHAAGQDAGAAAGHDAGRAVRIRDLSITRGDRLVVADFSADFEPGTLNVIAGPSGAGKSSIVAAMLGFIPYRGTIECGEIAWCGQTPGLSSGTVADNVALGSSLEPGDAGRRARVLQSLRRAALPDAGELLELELGVGGAGVSGGQAQRIAIARALYRWQERRTPVLLLDEPSSALDSETEAALIASLRAAADEGATVIVVSHREAVIAAADVVTTVKVLHNV